MQAGESSFFASPDGAQPPNFHRPTVLDQDNMLRIADTYWPKILSTVLPRPGGPPPDAPAKVSDNSSCAMPCSKSVSGTQASTMTSSSLLIGLALSVAAYIVMQNKYGAY